jgi:hypothetical protein
MRKPPKSPRSKKASKAPAEEENFPAGRAWERIKQFRISRGLDSPGTPPGAKPVKLTKTSRPAKKRTTPRPK